MSRFFKSAAFPILIVIVLAFFASKLIQNGNQAPATKLRPVPRRRSTTARSTRVVLRTKDNSAEVTLKGAGQEALHEGWVPGDCRRALVNKLRVGRGRRQDQRLRRQAGALERDPVAADVRASRS